MKIMAFNGSPRKEWNTATLLGETLRGATSKGASTELIHLYDHNYKGCRSCFACKLKGGKSYGRCASRDDLTPILKRVEETDAIILATPVYLGTESGEMRSFLERLLFPYFTYTNPPQSLFPKKIRVALIFTLGATEKMTEEMGQGKHLSLTERFTSLVLGEMKTLYSYDTYQFDDYSKYESSRFDPVHKAQQRQNVFSKDRETAFAMGTWLAEGKE